MDNYGYGVAFEGDLEHAENLVRADDLGFAGEAVSGGAEV